MRIDPNTGRKTIVAPHVRAVAIAAAPGGRAFASNGWDAVNRLPPAVLSRITLTGGVRGARPAQPTGLVYMHGTLWVVASARRSILAFNKYSIDSALNIPSALIAVGRAPAGIAYGEGSVWVANRGDGTISQIDATSERVVRTIHVGYRPAGITVGAGAVWATTHRVRATAAASGLLAFDDHGQIYTSRPDGTERRQLTRTRRPLQNIEPAWSPDGRRIAFLRVRRGKQYPSVFAVPELTPVSLYVMNADGTRQRRIPHTNDSDGSAPAWSPDGTKLAFSAGKPSRIYTIEPDGTHRTRVAGVPAKSYDVAWSPDGTQIGFDSNAHRRKDIFNVYTIQSDGTRLRRLTRIPSQYIQWSPDGRQIIFNRYRSDHTFLGEYTAPASGGPGVRLLPATNKYPGSENPGPAVVSWSPDGAVIVVSGLPGATPPAIYIANADGTGLSFVTRGNDASWRPVP